jgi:hypothetical protein
MRLYSIRVVMGILVLAVFGLQLLMSPIAASSIDASVEIKPETLNVKENRGGVITAFIEFHDSQYNVSDINFTSIELQVDIITAVGSTEPIRCILADDKLVAKFDASEVAGLIRNTLGHMQPTPPKAERRLVVKGTVSGFDFEGSDWIRVILP